MPGEKRRRVRTSSIMQRQTVHRQTERERWWTVVVGRQCMEVHVDDRQRCLGEREERQTLGQRQQSQNGSDLHAALRLAFGPALLHQVEVIELVETRHCPARCVEDLRRVLLETRPHVGR